MSRKREVEGLFYSRFRTREQAIMREFVDHVLKLAEKINTDSNGDLGLDARKREIEGLYGSLNAAIEKYNAAVQVANKRIALAMGGTRKEYIPPGYATCTIPPLYFEVPGRVWMSQIISKDHPLYRKYQKRLDALDKLEENVMLSLTLGSNYKKLFTEVLDKLGRL